MIKDIYNYLNICDSVPSMPNVVMKALCIIRNEKSSFIELTKIISYDQSLVTQVLKLVNSAYYGFPQQITSLNRAVTLIGMDEVRKLVIAAAMKPMLTSRGGKTLWEHCVTTAIASEFIAKKANIIHPDDAFVLGFLHDIGKIVLNHASPIIYNKVKALQKEGSDIIQIENMLLGTTHTNIGFVLAKRWQLPIIIANCIKYHHSPKLSSMSNVVGLVMFADLIANDDLNKNTHLKVVKITTGIDTNIAEGIKDRVFDASEKLIESLS